MVVAGFWIRYVAVGAKEVAIGYGYEQYYFHLFAARPLLYFALLLRCGTRRACLVLGIVLAVLYAGCILCIIFGRIASIGFLWPTVAFLSTEHALWLIPGILFALGFGERRAAEQ